MTSSPSTFENTSFLARFDPNTQTWIVTDTNFKELTKVAEKVQVELFVQQFCQLNYSDKDKYAARIYWSDSQRVW